MYKPGSFPKRCSCGREWTRAEWDALRFDGVIEGTIDGQRFYDDLELRRCICESTIAIAIEELRHAML